MKHIIDALKCRHDHPHDHVAGSCQVKGLGRKLVSQYSELYTRVFVEKVIKCLQCNSSAGEKNSPAQEGHDAMVIRPAETVPEDTSFRKRQRLDAKQAPSTAYRQALEIEQQTHRCVQIALKDSPRVGKRFFWSGELYDKVQR